MIIISNDQLKAFDELKFKQRIHNMSHDIQKDFADWLKGRNPEEIHETVLQTVETMRAYGIRQGQHLYLLASWGVFYGSDFVQRLGDGLVEILNDFNLEESEKINRVKERLDMFFPSSSDE